MKQGGRFAKKSAGFTIVETMIVLAVSGGLFLIAALYIGGKQAKTEFQVGIRDVQTRLQQIIAQTQSGYYGIPASTGCSTSNGPSSDLRISGSAELGTSGDCVFIGKAIVVNSTNMYVYPLAGARQVAGVDTTNPVTARATVALPVGTSPETFALPNGLTLYSSSYDSQSLTPGSVRGFAILSSMSKGNDSATGSQTFNLFGFHQTFTLPAANFLNTINAEKGDGIVAFPTKQAVGLCLMSGGTDQSALITIGGASGLAVHTDIKSGTSC